MLLFHLNEQWTQSVIGEPSLPMQLLLILIVIYVSRDVNFWAVLFLCLLASPRYPLRLSTFPLWCDFKVTAIRYLCIQQ